MNRRSKFSVIFFYIAIACLFCSCVNDRQYIGVSKNEIVEQLRLSDGKYLLGYYYEPFKLNYSCISYSSKDLIYNDKRAMLSKKWHIDFAGKIGWLIPQSSQTIIFDHNDIVIEQYTTHTYDGP